MENDCTHFSNLKPPLSPNLYEVEIYKKYIGTDRFEKVLLLGYTKELIDLATIAIDINPINHPKVKKGNWFDISDNYDVIMGDGVLNLVGGSLVDKLLSFTNLIIIRFFPEKLECMKYATYFKNDVFLSTPPTLKIETNKSWILVWDKRQ